MSGLRDFGSRGETVYGLWRPTSGLDPEEVLHSDEESNPRVVKGFSSRENSYSHANSAIGVFKAQTNGTYISVEDSPAIHIVSEAELRLGHQRDFAKIEELIPEYQKELIPEYRKDLIEKIFDEEDVEA